ncbi:hypothetical protein I3760_14G067900 [Carya illinoinensis]|nr:hypothetical protein I3760_14G067900 [Carya illinoinensis]
MDCIWGRSKLWENTPSQLRKNECTLVMIKKQISELCWSFRYQYF